MPATTDVPRASESEEKHLWLALHHLHKAVGIEGEEATVGSALFSPPRHCSYCVSIVRELAVTEQPKTLPRTNRSPYTSNRPASAWSAVHDLHRTLGIEGVYDLSGDAGSYWSPRTCSICRAIWTKAMEEHPDYRRCGTCDGTAETKIGEMTLESSGVVVPTMGRCPDCVKGWAKR